MVSKEILPINLPPYEGGRGRSIIGLGETVYDIIFRNNQPERAVPGGSAFNAIISLGRVMQKADAAHRASVTMITETGDDHIGRLTLDFMQQNGVSTELVSVRPGSKSHISLAFLDDQNNAQYQFYKDHASAQLNKNASAPSLLNAFSVDDVLLFGSFFAINPVIHDHTYAILKAAHDAGSVLYYDINFRKSHIEDIPFVMENIEGNMRLSTVMRGSAEDFGYLYGTEHPLEVYEQHIRPHCPIFICTDGPRATWLFAPNAANPGTTLQVRIPTEALPNVVSTIGAGDNFNAGFVYALISNHLHADDLSSLSPAQWMQLIEVGQQFSAHVCQRIENYVDQDFLPNLEA